MTWINELGILLIAGHWSSLLSPGPSARVLGWAASSPQTWKMMKEGRNMAAPFFLLSPQTCWAGRIIGSARHGPFLSSFGAQIHTEPIVMVWHWNKHFVRKKLNFIISWYDFWKCDNTSSSYTIGLGYGYGRGFFWLNCFRPYIL